MRAGRLRNRVQIQSKTTARNGYGEAIETWSTAATVWARVRIKRGREYLVGQGEAEGYEVEIGMRERGLTQQQRILWTDRSGVARVFDVVGVSPAEQPGGEMVVMCKEVER